MSEQAAEKQGIKPSEFVSKLIRVDGNPWEGKCGFDNWHYLRDAYDNPSRKIIFKCSRQIGKSTTLGNILLTHAILEHPIKELYVSSSDDKAKAFGKDRLRSVIEYSPGLSSLFKNPIPIRDIETRTGSIIRVRTAYTRGDQLRTYTGKVLCIDEAQEIPEDAFFIIEACTLMFPGEYKIFIAGTPLTQSNYLSQLYSKFSTACEWVMRCDACGHHNFPTIDMIGENGPICTKCKGPVDVRNGEWVRAKEAEFEGYHFNQILNPKYALNQQAWQEIIAKMKRWPTSKFYNEILGEAYDFGTGILTLDTLKSVCGSYQKLTDPSKAPKHTLNIAGVDWGPGLKSYTVLVIICWNGARFDTLFAKRYTGIEAHPELALNDLVKWIKAFNCKIVGADWGFGFKWNQDLMKQVGEDKVLPIAYVGQSSEKFKWDAEGYRLVTNRTMVVSDTYHLIKNKKISFYSADQFIPEFGDDLTTVYIEETQLRTGETKFRYARSIDKPDDFLHALTFALIAAQRVVSIPEFWLPGNPYYAL